MILFAIAAIIFLILVLLGRISIGGGLSLITVCIAFLAIFPPKQDQVLDAFLIPLQDATHQDIPSPEIEKTKSLFRLTFTAYSPNTHVSYY